MSEAPPDTVKQLEATGAKVVQVSSKVLSSLISYFDTWLDSKINR